MTTKSKSTTSKAPAARTTTKTRTEIAAELQTLIEPFGWKVNENAIPHLQAAELDAVAEWLDDAWRKTPMAAWGLIVIPNQQWIGYFNNPNDPMAVVSTILSHRGEFAPDPEDPVARLIDHIDESGAKETRFGWIFLEADPELMIWFGRKAGRTPNLFGETARTAIQKLFNVPRVSDAGTPLPIEKPKHTARQTVREPKAESGKPPAKSTTKLSDVMTGPRSAKGDPKATPSMSLMMIPLSNIVPAKDNHRKTFDKAKLQELADSIKQHGILQPLLLRTRPDADPPYEIIAGERRYRAAQLAGLERVPAQIVEREGLQASLAMLEENIRREDLSPIERANAIRSLIDAHGLTQKEVGKMIGVTQGQVSNELRLLQLPPTLQQEVASGAIAPTLIRSVLPYTDLPDVLETMTAELLADKGPYTEQCLTDYLSAAILKASRSMDFAATWQTYQNPDPKRRHFQDVSNLDLKSLDVRKIEAVESWQGQDRTFNLELFDRLNAEPLAARRKKHAAWKAKNKVQMSSSKTGKSKSAASFFENHYKLEDAIEEDMQQLLADAIERSKDKAAVLRVVIAFTVATEGAVMCEMAGKGVYNTDATRAVIDKLTGSANDMHATLRTACLSALRYKNYSQSAEESYCYAAVLGIELWKHWTVTPAVLEVLTDAGRAEFADKEPGHIPEFLRPFFALDVVAPSKGKAKKGKAA